MNLKARYYADMLAYVDEDTGEWLSIPGAPVLFRDEFHGFILGGSTIPSPWNQRDTNGGTQDFAADAPDGRFELALSAANEIQLAGLDFGNQRTLTLNRGLVFQAVVTFPVLPTGAVVACIGLCGDHNAAVNSVAESAWFRLDGSGAITVETDDGTNETSQVATGTTVTTADEVVLRIECEDDAALRFYINGARVASGTTFNMSATPALQLQPVFRIGKESAATTVGTMRILRALIAQRGEAVS